MPTVQVFAGRQGSRVSTGHKKHPTVQERAFLFLNGFGQDTSQLVRAGLWRSPLTQELLISQLGKFCHDAVGYCLLLLTPSHWVKAVTAGCWMGASNQLQCRNVPGCCCIFAIAVRIMIFLVCRYSYSEDQLEYHYTKRKSALVRAVNEHLKEAALHPLPPSTAPAAPVCACNAATSKLG
jgi:hypothetical protein